MEESFRKFTSEVQSKQLRTSIETLIKIYRNIQINPLDMKFRTIKLTNKRFAEDVWNYEHAKQFMRDCGWVVKTIESNVCTVFPANQNIRDSLQFLIDNRDVKPSIDEWDENTKHIIPNAEKERDRVLRAEANIKKEKDIAEVKKDMAERKEIAAQIVAEHRNDRKKRIYHKAVSASPLPKYKKDGQP